MIHSLRNEIAKELFLESISKYSTKLPDMQVKILAEQAFKSANLFTDIQAKQPSPLKGCPKCFGSGGKVADPCKNCNGTGKVAK